MLFRLCGRSILGAFCFLLPICVGAQSATFGTGAGSYALLNGSYLALYIDRFGDLGAPMTSSVTLPKPGGLLDSLEQPYINSDGSVDTPVLIDGVSTSITYAALYSAIATSGSIQQQVQAKTEYITLGNLTAVEGWSVSVNGGSSFIPYDGTGMSAAPITASYNASTGLLTATSATTYMVGATDLEISQEVLFNDSARPNILQFVITFTNNGTTTITGLQYARAIDPNQGVAPPGTSADVNTMQAFGTPADPTQFAVNSIDQEGLNRSLALGVRNSDLNSAGSIIYAASASQTESSILSSPQPTNQGDPSYIQLDANGDGGANYVTAINPAMDAHTANFEAYLETGGVLDPFLTSGNVGVTPVFTSYPSDTDLVLLSPQLSLAPGASTTFTFYYTFLPVPVPSSTLSGDISLEGCANLAQTLTFTFAPAEGDAFSQSVTLASDGSYTIDAVPNGTYTIGIKGPKWLKTDLTNVDVSGGAVTGVNATLLPGDINGDNVVDIQDFSLLAAAYGSDSSSSNWNTNADLNCDGVVNIEDFSLLAADYGLSGDP
jgi:hypothetical protein